MEWWTLSSPVHITSLVFCKKKNFLKRENEKRYDGRARVPLTIPRPLTSTSFQVKVTRIPLVFPNFALSSLTDFSPQTRKDQVSDGHGSIAERKRKRKM